MTAFIRRELHKRLQGGFSILLPASDAVRLFGKNLKISRIAAVPQEHQHPRLILDLLAQTYKGVLSVNDTMVREIALESM